MNNPQYDIIFCVLPPMGVDRIYSAPPSFKGMLQSIGYSVKCFDFAMDLFNFSGRDIEKFSSLQNYFSVKSLELSPEDTAIIDRLREHIINTVVSTPTKYVGFTVFSYFTQKFLTELMLRFKELGITDKIVLGGRGLSTLSYDTVDEFIKLTDEERKIDFVDLLKQRGLLKHAIIGDGENALVEFLQNNTIDGRQHKVEKLVFNWPDYEDYNIDDYMWPADIPTLYVTGSTGCVRSCDFCDVAKQFGKYKFKGGRELAEELIHLQERYGINKFVLNDSLSNGGMKPFREYLNRLIEHNRTAAVPIAWSGQYICRDLRYLDDVDGYYRTLKDSGAQGLTIGAESGSNHVLDCMDKKTTVEALFFELENFRKYGLTCQLLTFTGHWSERHEDFVDHCRMYVNIMPYVRAGVISAVQLGMVFQLLPGTPAYDNLNMIKSKISNDIWIARNNRGNTFRVRLKRRLIVSRLCQLLKLGIDIEESQNLQLHSETIKHYGSSMNDFFVRHAQGDSSQFDAIADAETFINSVLNYKDTVDLQLQVEANSANGDPNLVVQINDHVLYSQELAAGTHDIVLSVPCDLLTAHNRLSIAMTNKGPDDTEVDVHGNIIRDKNIIVTGLTVDSCDLVNDVEFFYSKFYYLKDGVRSSASPGLWFNQELCLDFDLPFVQWYANTSYKNVGNDLSDMYHQQTNGLFTVNEYYNRITDQIAQLII